MARIELVDVQDAVVRAAQAQIAARRARVLDAHRDVAGQLAVDVKGVLLHVRCPLVLIDEVDVATHTLERPEGIAARLRDAARERIRQRGRRHELALLNERVLAVAHLTVVGRANELVVPGRPVDAVAAAHDRLRIRRVDDADARRELRAWLIALLGPVAVDAGIHQTAAHGAAVDHDVAQPAAGVERAVEADREAVCFFAQAVLVLDPQAAVDRQLGADAEVVLQVGAVVAREVVGRFRHQDPALVAGVARGRAQQETGQGVTGRIHAVHAVRVRIRRREPSVELEHARAAGERLGVDADRAEVEASLHGVTPHQPRGRGIRAPRVQVPVGRVDGAERVVVGDVDARKLLRLDRAAERRGEPERGRIEIDRQGVVVAELRVAVAQRHNSVVARQPGVVERQGMNAALEDVVAVVDEPVGPAQAGLEVIGARLVGRVVEIEPAQRHHVAEPVVQLAGVHLRAIHDLSGRRVVRQAIADIAGRILEEAQHVARHRIEAVGRDDVARERRAAVAACVTGQRIVDDDQISTRVARLGEIPGLLERGGQAQVVTAGGVGAVAFAGHPEERAVLQDRAAETATAQMVVGVRQRYATLLREEVVGRAPAWPVLVEDTAAPRVGARARRHVERAAAGAARLGVIVVHLHGHVIDRFDGGVGRGTVADVGHRHTVDEVVVAAARAAAE